MGLALLRRLACSLGPVSACNTTPGKVDGQSVWHTALSFSTRSLSFSYFSFSCTLSPAEALKGLVHSVALIFDRRQQRTGSRVHRPWEMAPRSTQGASEPPLGPAIAGRGAFLSAWSISKFHGPLVWSLTSLKGFRSPWVVRIG